MKIIGQKGLKAGSWSGRVAVLLSALLVAAALFCMPGPTWAEDSQIELPVSSLMLSSEKNGIRNEETGYKNWRLESRGAWLNDYDINDPLDPTLSMRDPYNPLEQRSMARVGGRLAKDLNFSLAVAMLDQGPRSTSRNSGYKTASTGPLKPIHADDSRLGQEPMALSVGVDWRVYGRTGIHLGYLYGADPSDSLSGDLEPLATKPQSVDLAYNYYLDGVYFSLGYIYNITPLIDSQQTNYDSTKALEDSTVYLRFQLRF